MTSFARFNITATCLFIVVCGMAACGKPQASPASPSEPAARGDLLKAPPELAGKNPVEQGLAYINVVDESFPESSNPLERHFRIKAGVPFSARGWAFDDKRNTTPPVWLELVSKSGVDLIYVPARRTPAKELAESFHHPWAGVAGFEVPGEQANIRPDTYQVTVFQADPDMVIKTPFYSVQKVTITVE